MVVLYFAVVFDIHEIERVQSVLAVDIYAVVAVAQHEYHARLDSLFRVRRNDGVQTLCNALRIAVCLAVGGEIHHKIVQSEVGYGDVAVYILQVLQRAFLQFFQLQFAVVHLLVFFGDDIVVRGRRRVDDRHARRYALIEIDVFVQRNIRPKIHELNALIFTADTVDSPEPLHDTDGIPMNIVIDADVAILQVLPFGNAVRTDENVYFFIVVRINSVLLLGDGRKQREQAIGLRRSTLVGFVLVAARYNRRI